MGNLKDVLAGTVFPVSINTHFRWNVLFENLISFWQQALCQIFSGTSVGQRLSYHFIKQIIEVLTFFLLNSYQIQVSSKVKETIMLSRIGVIWHHIFKNTNFTSFLYTIHDYKLVPCIL